MVAKDGAALNTEGVSVAKPLEKIMLVIESGQGRGLREVGIFVNLNKETERAQKLAELHGNELDENAEATTETSDGSGSRTD
jgi:hypothetical protein